VLRVKGLGFRIRVEHLDLGFRVKDLGLKV
jgi:hypothetical protein